MQSGVPAALAPQTRTPQETAPMPAKRTAPKRKPSSRPKRTKRTYPRDPATGRFRRKRRPNPLYSVWV